MALKRIHTSPDPVLAGWLVSILETAGVPCTVRNGYLGGAAGELPPNECWPELWILDDRDEALARRLIERATSEPAPDGPAWRCSGCGETIEAAFGTCWQCGTERAYDEGRRG